MDGGIFRPIATVQRNGIARKIARGGRKANGILRCRTHGKDLQNERLACVMEIKRDGGLVGGKLTLRAVEIKL